MSRHLIYFVIVVISQNFGYSQQNESRVLIPADSLEFHYFHYKLNNSIMKDCNWYYDYEFKKEVQDVFCVHIYTKEGFDFFLKNIKDFEHVKALSLFKIKIEDFNFLSKLPNTEYVSLGVLNKKNIKSFVDNLKQNQKLSLLKISKLNTKDFPKELNELKHLKSLQIANTKRLKRIVIDLDLKHLIFESNKRLKYIKADNVDYISIFNSDIKRIPEGLSESKNLKGIQFSLNYKLEVACPLYGFENLEIFDIFGQSSSTTSRLENDCFLNNKKVKIYNP